jgi:predicted dithiol-disulfide oxidoreductase (DUF899 family)
VNYSDSSKQLDALRKRIAEARREMRAVQANVEPQVVDNYVFASSDGNVRLSELFGNKQDLFVIHNMGSTCPYCTLWADGFNGLYEHLASRAAFIVSSPDTPETQRRFARSRGWRFPMVSHEGTTFAADMGYRSDKGGWLPGVSVFQMSDARIVRVSDSGFGPEDDFCALWHFLELLPGGRSDWQPRFSYGSR